MRGLLIIIMGRKVELMMVRSDIVDGRDQRYINFCPTMLIVSKQ